MAKDLEKGKEVEDPKSGAKALAVVDHAGHVVREYSFEIHGAEMQKAAEEFAKKFGHTVQKAR